MHTISPEFCRGGGGVVRGWDACVARSRNDHQVRTSKVMTDFMNFPTQRERVLTYGNTTIGIISDICLVSHFQVGSWQVLYRPEETGNVKRWGLPLMIPNFSRLKDGIFKEKNTTLPIHGFGRDLPWTVVSGQDRGVTSLKMQLARRS